MARNSKPSNKKSNRKSNRDHSRSGPTAQGWVDRSGKVHTPSHSRGKPKPTFDRPKGHGGGRSHAPSHVRHSVERAPNQTGAPQGSLVATVEKTKSGTAFLVFSNQKRKDVFVSRELARDLMTGDRVEFTLDSRGDARHVKVIERRLKELLGRWAPDVTRRGESGHVVVETRKIKEQIYVEAPPPRVRLGDWVKVELKGKGEGEIKRVIGPELKAIHDLELIETEFGWVEKHSEAAIQEAKDYGDEVTQADFQARKDLTQVPFITIDGEDARDFDDAVYVERVGDGYKLWVAIADVSHYVKAGTALDAEARGRGTSVYFPERAFHMLPRELSENLCSLRPKVRRLALTACIHFDRDGQKKETELFESVILSKRRATYNEIQDEWKANLKNKNWEFKPHFELFEILKKLRGDRGSIDFDLPETKILVDSEGEPTQIQRRERFEAHRLIEEFMIAANEAVTEWAEARSWPFIFRIHDEPDGQRIAEFKELAATFGLVIALPGGPVTPKGLASVVKKMEGHPSAQMLNYLLLRSLRQAVYSVKNDGHFGLASSAYTHFTSPIRRYPDLVVHRMLRMALREHHAGEFRHQPERRATIDKDLSSIAEHCSYRERLAADAERESHKIKQVRLMKRHLGEEFDAFVNGMNDRGLFLQIREPWVEGFLPRDALDFDQFQYVEDKMTYVGRRTRQVIKLGDQLRVLVARAEIDTRQIELTPVEAPVPSAPNTRVDTRKKR